VAALSPNGVSRRLKQFTGEQPNFGRGRGRTPRIPVVRVILEDRQTTSLTLRNELSPEGASVNFPGGDKGREVRTQAGRRTGS